MIRARLRLMVSNKQASSSLVRAVEADNRVSGLVVTGRLGDQSATLKLAYDGRIETFISTLDDMLQCLQAADDALKSVTRKLG